MKRSDFTARPPTAKKTPIGLDTEVYRWVVSRMTDLGVSVDAVGNMLGAYNQLNVYDRLVIINSGLEKPFKLEPIKSALNIAIDTMRLDRLADLRAHLDSNEPYDRDIHAKLVGLMASATDHDQDDGYRPEECALLIEKTIWQVKRKLFDVPVERHLMVVFAGKQGAGKSVFVNAMTRPVSEITVNTNIRNICDDRNISLFNNYVAFLDELEKADRVDVEEIKNVISATTLARRPMRMNSFLNIKQNLTFLGACNKDFGELVVDDTGNRRFAQIDMISPDNPRINEFWKSVNGFDWLSLWRSIGHNHADPAKGINLRIIEQQRKTRSKSMIEYWIDYLVEECVPLVASRDLHTSQSIYDQYRAWEERNGRYITSHVIFQRSFFRMCRQKEIPFESARTKTARGYKYTGELVAMPKQQPPRWR